MAGPKPISPPAEEFSLKVNTENLKPVGIVIENFYEDVDGVREFALSQDFEERGNYPGKRTKSYATEEIRDFLEKCVFPYGGKITDFNTDTETSHNANGCFQITFATDRSWMHTDGHTNWAAIVYLTPDAPISGGTGLFQYEGGERWVEDNLENKIDFSRISQDITKWKQIDNFGNIYNRMVIFNSTQYHMSLDYFGSDKNDARLFQVFFFSTER
jgi:hypothetical protein